MLGASDVIFNHEVESFLVCRLGYRFLLGYLSSLKTCLLCTFTCLVKWFTTFYSTCTTFDHQ